MAENAEKETSAATMRSAGRSAAMRSEGRCARGAGEYAAHATTGRGDCPWLDWFMSGRLALAGLGENVGESLLEL